MSVTATGWARALCVLSFIFGLGAGATKAFGEMATGNETVGSRWVCIFAPCYHDLGEGGEANTKTKLEEEGLLVLEYIDSVIPATSTPICKMTDMQGPSGVAFVDSHGWNYDEMIAETFATKPLADAAVTARKASGWKYIGDEDDDPNTPDTWEFEEVALHGYWCLAIHKRGMSEHLRGENEDCGTLTFNGACYSWYWSEAWGGREYFGYDDTGVVSCNSWQTTRDSGLLWDYMTGVLDNPNSRTAGLAYVKGTPPSLLDTTKFLYYTIGDTPQVGKLCWTSSADGKTTLAPAVVDYFPKNYACSNCTGWVKFDSKMNVSEVLGPCITISGNAHVASPLRWNSAHDEVSFDITAVTPGESYTLYVIASLAISSPGSNHLDGNSSPQGVNAQRPGYDNFVWTVTGDVGACDPSFVQADRRNMEGLEEARKKYRERVAMRGLQIK